MTDGPTLDTTPSAVTLWLDPVCPFSWNTARWLTSVADKAGFDIEWRVMSLAILNDGRDLPAPQRARMDDSRRVGRLMAALHAELGAAVVGPAYMAFADQYFDHSATVNGELVNHVLHAVAAERTTAAALGDNTFDVTVAEFHQASQDALGETGGSPMLTVDGDTVFGPVLTAVPDSDEGLAVFGAVATLVRTSEFSQLHRPRSHG